MPYRLLRAGLVCAGLAGFAHAPLLLAHGATHEVEEADAIALRFSYLLGEAMADAPVRVQPPGSQTVHQRGHTDVRGRFAFVPDRPGTWILEADDGSGHAVRARVEVGGQGAQDTAPQTVRIPSRLLVAALVASLLLNAALVSLLRVVRRRATG